MRLHTLEALNQVPLTFAVTQAPPSEADIAARREVIPASVGLWRDFMCTLHLFVTGLLICVAFFGLLYVMLSGLTEGFTGAELAVRLLAVALVTIMAGLVDRRATRYAKLHTLVTERDSLAPLSNDRCAELLAACEATPEGMAYREQVLRLNRQFVMAELAMLTTWAEQAGTREACRKLYNLEQPQ